MREIREFVRIDVNKDVKYRVLRSKTIVPSESKDVSAGGIMFDTTECLAKGSVLELKLLLFEDVPPISAMGEVAWSKEIKGKSGKKAYVCGVKFSAIAPKDRQRVHEYVHNEVMKRRISGKG